MHSTAATDDLILKQLDKILSSAGFVRNDRLSRFLRFVVTQQLEGKAEHKNLLGKAAVANAKVAYERFERIFGGERSKTVRRKHYRSP